MSKRYDRIFREHLQAIFPHLLAAYNKTEYTQAKPLPTALVKTVHREPDFLFEMQTAQGPQVWQVEVQTRPDPAMPRRMYLYSALLFDKHQLPVKQFVLYIGGGRKAMSDTLPLPDFTFRYQLVDFRRIPYRSLLGSDDPALVIFAILGDFGGETREAAATAIVHRLQEVGGESPGAFVHLQVLAELRNLGAFVRQLETKMALDIKDTETSLYKLGRETGKEQGKELGKELGKEERAMEVAARMLRKGFAPALVAELTDLPLTRVQELAGRLSSP